MNKQDETTKERSVRSLRFFEAVLGGMKYARTPEDQGAIIPGKYHGMYGMYMHPKTTGPVRFIPAGNVVEVVFKDDEASS